MNCYILGAGAHGRVVVDILESRGVAIAGFVDDDARLHGALVSGYPVLYSTPTLLAQAGDGPFSLIVALGAAPLRLRLTQAFLDRGLELINAVHRQAIVSPAAALGRGVCLCAAAVINPDAVLGDAVIVNTGATVDHDCIIADGVHLSPGVHLAGRVNIGALSFLGVGVSVAPRVSIGPGTIIGAGSVVVGDIPADVLAYGAPARVIRPLHGQFDWSRLL